MKIDHYSFGKLIINGKTYTSDVIIYPGRVDSSWWRKEGHYLRASDITGVFDSRPDVLIVGTGYSGIMVVPEVTIRFVRSKGIEVLVEKTEKAVALYNKLAKEKTVVAALHLTC